jgi:hypothetical protein
MDPEKFWDLSWYEWGLYVLRLFEHTERQKAQQEFVMAMNGDLMAMLANINRDQKKHPGFFTRNDFYKLHLDTQLKKEVDPELFAKVAKKLGGTIKKKKGDK